MTDISKHLPFRFFDVTRINNVYEYNFQKLIAVRRI